MAWTELMGKENFVGWIPAGSTRATVGGRRFSDVTNSGLSFYSSHIKNLDNIHREDFDKKQHLQQVENCSNTECFQKKFSMFFD